MKYSDNLNYLVPAIIYLGSHTYYWARTPYFMARELSLDEDRLKSVFDGFPDIFRKSRKIYGGYDQHFYALQARYAQRQGKGTEDPEKVSHIPALETDRLEMVINFVVHMSEQEKEDKRSSFSNIIAVSSAVIAALAAIVATIF